MEANIPMDIIRLILEAVKCFTVVKNRVLMAAQNIKSEENPEKQGCILLLRATFFDTLVI